MYKNIIFGLSSLVLIFSCKSPAPQAPPAGPVPVNTIQVSQQAATYHEIYPGTTIPLNEVELRSEVSGFLTNIYFQEGRTVKKGQKLYEIERSKYLANYEQAKANLQVAKANLERSQRDAERYTKLGEQDAIAKQRVEYAQTDLQNAKQQVTAANAQFQSAQTELSHSIITAPFDGTIGISQVKLGAFISTGQTLLNTISSDDPIAVDFVVNEQGVYRFIKMQKAKENSSDSTFTMLLPDKSVYPFPGKISVIDRAVDPTTGTMKIRLLFPNPEKELRAGMSCNVRVLNGDLDKSMLVPMRAVTEQMGEYFIYAVQNDTARQRKVVLGPMVGENVVVKEGINPGDQVVVEGIQKLKEGTPVQKAEPQPAGAAAQSASK